MSPILRNRGPKAISASLPSGTVGPQNNETETAGTVTIPLTTAVGNAGGGKLVISSVVSSLAGKLYVSYNGTGELGGSGTFYEAPCVDQNGVSYAADEAITTSSGMTLSFEASGVTHVRFVRSSGTSAAIRLISTWSPFSFIVNALKAISSPFGGARVFSVETALTKGSATSFSAMDIIAAASPTVITFANVGRAIGAGGIITNATIAWSTVIASAPTLLLFLFEVSPATLGALADGDAFAPTDGEMADCIGVIRFEAADKIAGTLNMLYQGTFVNGNIPFKCGASVDDLYGILVSEDAATLGASEIATIRMGGQQD